MFSDEILEKILTSDEMRQIPVGCQSTAIRVIEKILDEEEKKGKVKNNDAIHQS